MYDTKNDPHEMKNLARDRKADGELLLAMNDKLNKVIDDEVGRDMGQHLPEIQGVKWAFDRFDP